MSVIKLAVIVEC